MDLIDRQDAIDAHCELCEDSGRCNCDICPDVEVFQLLPSAQPEIVRCKDCKYWHREIHNGIEYFNFSSCDLNHHGDGHDFYCADAERRTNDL